VAENNGKTDQNEYCEHFIAQNCIVSCAIFVPRVGWKKTKAANDRALNNRVIITAGYSGEIRIYENVVQL